MGRAPVVLFSALVLLAVEAASAFVIPAAGPHEVVDLWSSTTRPNTSASLGYAAHYHAAYDSHADPPALRHLVIQLPRGTKIDTSVPRRCAASDDTIRFAGESACPRSARIGHGEATVKILGAGTMTFPTVIYNARNDMLELVKSGDRVLAVVHTYVRGNRLDGPVPTCLDGGNPPKGCPFDQFVLLANHLEISLLTRQGRNYGTSPPRCPRSRRWRTPVTLHSATARSTRSRRKRGACPHGSGEPMPRG
jgi:hypothetical protein